MSRVESLICRRWAWRREEKSEHQEEETSKRQARQGQVGQARQAGLGFGRLDRAWDGMGWVDAGEREGPNGSDKNRGHRGGPH